ncbi:MAG: hypothetical protein JSS26_19350 [Nitrospira sp.]|nr:hypothetical protein [Nitrospira sp.]
MQFSKLALLCTVAFVLQGCDAMMYRPFAPGNALNRDGTFLDGRPTEAAQSAADYGTSIEQSAAQQLAESWLTLHLKDSESARYQWGVVQRGYTKDPLISGGAVNYGYLLPVLVNAKNSYGGYTGFEQWGFLFHNGTLLRVMHNGAVAM